MFNTATPSSPLPSLPLAALDRVHFRKTRISSHALAVIFLDINGGTPPTQVLMQWYHIAAWMNVA